MGAFSGGMLSMLEFVSSEVVRMHDTLMVSLNHKVGRSAHENE
jgi:hypothetical protein